MGIETKLSLKMTTHLVMTPALQQAIKMLPLTRLELITKIRQEMTENPLLEDDSNTYTESEPENTQEEAASQDEPEQLNPTAEIDWDTYFKKSLYDGPASESYLERSPVENAIKKDISIGEHLVWQLNLIAKTDYEKYIGAIIIGNLDEDGYFKCSLEEIAKLTLASLEEVERVLKIIQGFDPSGVGARDIKECLLIQIRNLEHKKPLAETLIENYLERLTDKNVLRIAKELSVSVEDIQAAIKVIGELDPKPGSTFSPGDIQYISPDVVVCKSLDGYKILLNDDGIPRLRISSYYQDVIRKSNSTTKNYLEEKFKSAIWLIKSIEQRRQTLYKVSESIVKFQKDFLDKGLACLRPLVLRNVAEDIEMHESTVSRVTTGKYIYTPQGLFELKFFFHKGVNSIVGDECKSSLIVKRMIKDSVEEEDVQKPLTDIQLTSFLHTRNIDIARRTVTKYRKELKIPSASKRRKL